MAIHVRVWLGGLAACALLGSLAGTAPAIATSGSTYPGAGPLKLGASRLYDVASISPDDAWAVGYYRPTTGGYTRAHIEHWDGTNWTTVKSPSARHRLNSLHAVSAVSATDVWAVGGYAPTTFITLTEHWDGASWTRIPSPSPGGAYGNFLFGVSALSADDAWAVGEFTTDDGVSKTLTEHWDGTQWSLVPSPNPEGALGSELLSVSALSADDVWAAGDSRNSSNNGRTLIEHWDGTKWTRIPSPSPDKYQNFLYGVTAVSPNDVWVAGETSEFPKTLIEHWDGTAWAQVASPNVAGHANELYGMSSTSAGDVWAVGYYIAHGFRGNRTLILHWDGTTWSRVPSPNQAGSHADSLYGVSADSGTDAWVVGSLDQRSRTPLREHWDGSHWSLF